MPAGGLAGVDGGGAGRVGDAPGDAVLGVLVLDAVGLADGVGLADDAVVAVVAVAGQDLLPLLDLHQVAVGVVAVVDATPGEVGGGGDMVPVAAVGEAEGGAAGGVDDTDQALLGVVAERRLPPLRVADPGQAAVVVEAVALPPVAAQLEAEGEPGQGQAGGGVGGDGAVGADGEVVDPPVAVEEVVEEGLAAVGVLDVPLPETDEPGGVPAEAEGAVRRLLEVVLVVGTARHQVGAVGPLEGQRDAAPGHLQVGGVEGVGAGRQVDVAAGLDHRQGAGTARPLVVGDVARRGALGGGCRGRREKEQGGKDRQQQSFHDHRSFRMGKLHHQCPPQWLVSPLKIPFSQHLSTPQGL